jgi:hypothetical protein
MVERYECLLPLPEQRCGNSSVKPILNEPINLQLEVFISVVFKQFAGVLIDYWHCLQTSTGAELDIIGISQDQPSALHMLDNRFVQRSCKLLNGQVFGRETSGVHVVYVFGQDFLTSVSELDYPDEQVAHIVCYQCQVVHSYSFPEFSHQRSCKDKNDTPILIFILAANQP